MDTFKVLLNCVDHYQAAPTDLDPLLFGSHGSTQRDNAPTLPVIRVFGATETGQKVCAHIHGALPYLFVEYRGALEAADDYLLRLRASIDSALATSYRRSTTDGRAVFVAHMTLVKGVPFFGYHVGYRHFVKIYMSNPIYMTRFADLLHQGAIMGHEMQPFEAHIQYLAQWMCDFNLYGCATIDCRRVAFRGPVPDFDDLDDYSHRWHSLSVPDDVLLDSTVFPRQSHCAIEVDICVHDILNRHSVEPRDIHADFVERFRSPVSDEKLVQSLAGLWKDETRRRKLRMGLDDPSSSPFSPEDLVSMSADSRNAESGGWIHEEEFRGLVRELIEEESRAGSERLTFESFTSAASKEDGVQTVLASVEDLFPETLNKAMQEQPSSQQFTQFLQFGIAKRPFDGLDDADDLTDPDFEFPSDEEVAREMDLSQARSRGQDAAGSHPHEPPAKRRKLDTFSSPSAKHFLPQTDWSVPSAQRPRSRHARFLNHTDRKDEHTLSPFRWKSPQRSTSLSAPSSQEMSQSSIKSDLANPPNLQAFTPVKDYRAWTSSSQGIQSDSTLKDPRSPSRSQDTPSSTITIPDTILSSSSNMSFEVDPASSSNMSFEVDPASSSNMSFEVDPASSSNMSFEVDPASSSNVSDEADSDSDSDGLEDLVTTIESTFSIDGINQTFCLGAPPPTADDVVESMSHGAYLDTVYQDAFYGDERDVPQRSREYAGREFKLEGRTTPFLPDFDPTGTSLESLGYKEPAVVDAAKQEAEFQRRRQASNFRNWDFLELPPSYEEVEEWDADRRREESSKKTSTYREMQNLDPRRGNESSQIEGPTQQNPYGFKYSQKQKSTSVRHETQYMTTLSLEVHANSRGNLAPDPQHDEIQCVFWCLRSDDKINSSDGGPQDTQLGILVLSEDGTVARRIARETDVEMYGEDDELDLINKLVDIVRALDPDVLTGYEVHNGSWGYLIERARAKYDYNLCDELSRMKSQSHGRFGRDADRWGFNTTSTISITGRHMINIWRAMKSELNLLQYTMENVVFHLLHKRIPHYSHRQLTEWYTGAAPRDLAKCLEYFMSRARLDLDILEANELIARTSEQARLIGVDFFSVFSRGSQFKVESFMLRIAKPENFLLVSPSRKQVGQQNALECLPLVMEPHSDFYTSPVVVLDFQSLYPSIMIAYNYCYSTCLGRIVGWRGQNKLGFADFKRQPGLLGLVGDSINIAPNGIMYVKPEMRKSLLAKMLGEILETRVMVKSGMKEDRDDKTLQRLLNNRQLALKLLANVTYGYTSASFSGRMPCAEIADSIVQTGRETLERAIALIHSIERWGADVVYGDTDSLFVHLKGRSREQAFQIGDEMAKAITDMNPRPVKLKFEKVYHPCVLLAKKRYVGFKYESADQTEPEFDAKGIETVRRDGTPAEQKIEEKALKILFRTSDLSQVKAYFQRQCAKIMSGKVSIQDFCFAREVKLGTYADKGPPPPGALVATRRMLGDPRQEPQYGERVPYVVITGAPRARLIDRCVAPEVLLEDDSVELDAEYYISKNIIPPLERIFNLVGANVRQWYDEMPKVQRIRDRAVGIGGKRPDGTGAVKPGKFGNPVRRTILDYMRSSHCVLCRSKIEPRKMGRGNRFGASSSSSAHILLCDDCRADPSTSLLTLRWRLKAVEARVDKIDKVCRNCAGLSWAEDVKCDSKDCSVFYSRVRAHAESHNTGSLEQAVQWLEDGGGQSLDW